MRTECQWETLGFKINIHRKVKHNGIIFFKHWLIERATVFKEQSVSDIFAKRLCISDYIAFQLPSVASVFFAGGQLSTCCFPALCKNLCNIRGLTCLLKIGNINEQTLDKHQELIAGYFRVLVVLYQIIMLSCELYCSG